jgi:hypothetical protein
MFGTVDRPAIWTTARVYRRREQRVAAGTANVSAGAKFAGAVAYVVVA